MNQQHGFYVGDLVKMKRGYSPTGIVVEIITRDPHPSWLRILWADDGMGMEKARDVEVVNESR